MRIITTMLMLLFTSSMGHSARWLKDVAQYENNENYTRAIARMLPNYSPKASATQRALMARLLRRGGFPHLALTERAASIQALNKFSTRELALMGEEALMLGYLRPVFNVANKLIKKRISVKRWPASFRVALAWSRFRRGEIDKAAKLLPSIRAVKRLASKQAIGRAMFVAGTIRFAQKNLRAAGQWFSEMRNYDENSLDSGMSFLQRSRVFYELGVLGHVNSEVGMIQKSTAAWFPAMLVGAWSAYRVGDYNLTLGQLMTLRSPYLINKFNPEIHILEAATLFELCYYRSAGRSLKELAKRYKGLLPYINTFHRQNGNSSRGLSQVLNFARGSKKPVGNYSQRFWNLIMDGVLSEYPLLLVDRGLSIVEQEKKRLAEIKAATTNNRRTRSKFRTFSKRLKNARNEYSAWGVKNMNRRLIEMKEDLKLAQEQALTVKLEVDFRIRDRLYKGTRARKKRIDYDTEIKKGYEFWPFEGEFWKDELGGYYFVTSDVCGAKER